jgi:hypothetical protein
MVRQSSDNRSEAPSVDERTKVEGRLAELRYTAQMCAVEQIPLPEGTEAELRALEAKLKALKNR